eukprot:TRINITY_DN10403_c0_g1_i1.p1 TRINITY_DN10403_c0_g1~~TRINITY_DN10403_c0_g1_i1.p1  ORF type:complete len:562 (+),score=148.26 TRINITY_DN10403_c0_g1_i1:35-1720(+)
MGNAIDPVTKNEKYKLGTKEFEVLWGKYAKDGYISRSVAVKFIKKLAKALNLDFDVQKAEDLLNCLEDDKSSFNESQFKNLLLTLVSENETNLSHSLRRKQPIFGLFMNLAARSAMFGDAVLKVISQLMVYLKEHEYEKTEGIFRIPGNSTIMEDLAIKFNDAPYHFELTTSSYSVHDIGGLLKLFFRKMVEPIFPFSAYSDILLAAKQEDERLIEIKKVVWKLPPLNYKIFEMLLKFLLPIIENAEVTCMDAKNLATCFAPSLAKQENEDSKAFMEQNHYLTKFFEETFQNPQLFTSRKHADPTTFYPLWNAKFNPMSPRVKSTVGLQNLMVNPRNARRMSSSPDNRGNVAPTRTSTVIGLAELRSSPISTGLATPRNFTNSGFLFSRSPPLPHSPRSQNQTSPSILSPRKNTKSPKKHKKNKKTAENSDREDEEKKEKVKKERRLSLKLKGSVSSENLMGSKLDESESDEPEVLMEPRRSKDLKEGKEGKDKRKSWKKAIQNVDMLRGSKGKDEYHPIRSSQSASPKTPIIHTSSPRISPSSQNDITPKSNTPVSPSFL